MRRPRLPRRLRLEELRKSAPLGLRHPARPRERRPTSCRARSLHAPVDEEGHRGHDENITPAQVPDHRRAALLRIERASIALYERAAAAALESAASSSPTRSSSSASTPRDDRRRRRGARPDSSLSGHSRPHAPALAGVIRRKQYVRDGSKPRTGTRPPGPGCPTRCATARPRTTGRGPERDSPDARSRATATAGSARVKVTVLVRQGGGILDPQGEGDPPGVGDAQHPAARCARDRSSTSSSTWKTPPRAGRASAAGRPTACSRTGGSRPHRRRATGGGRMTRIGAISFPGTCGDRDALRAVGSRAAAGRASGTATPTSRAAGA